MGGRSAFSLSPDAPNTSNHEQTNSGSSNNEVVDLTDDLGITNLQDNSDTIVNKLTDNEEDECTSQRVDFDDRNLSPKECTKRYSVTVNNRLKKMRIFFQDFIS